MLDRHDALVFVSLCATVALAVPCAARAQRNFDVQLFTMPAGGGTTFTIDRPSVPRHLNAVFGFGANYAHEPFVRDALSRGDGMILVPGAPIVRNLFQLDAMAALGLFEVLELGVAIPVGVIDRIDGDPTDLTLTYGTVFTRGDVRLSAKVPILRGDFALSARFVAQLPTGDWNNFFGMEYWVATPSVVAAWTVGPIRLAGELGYRFRQRTAIAGFEEDDELALSAGAVWPVLRTLDAIAETQLRIGAGGRELRANEVPWEIDGGVRVWPMRGLSIEGGLGTGILAGYGVPALRVFAAVRFATEQDNTCAAGPEDYDGFEDGDFCADVDNDADRVLDSRDQCPNDAEDRDRFLDDDGCPDTDNDADGVVDATDACPTQSEDRDGFEDDDGCPEPDNDQDGVADGLDGCPMEPEDQDRYQDDDGCPEPGPETASVTVTDTRILISERIYFEFDRDVIRSVSMPLLDEVARVVQELPHHLRIRVDGYSDNEGSRAYNMDLSYRRARAVVEYLASRGVRRERMEYRGYGPENPVAPNDSPEGSALNRRVEFTILNAGEHAGETGRRSRPTAPAVPDRGR